MKSQRDATTNCSAFQAPNAAARVRRAFAAAAMLGAIVLLGVSCATTKTHQQGWKEIRGGSFALWAPQEFEVERSMAGEAAVFYLYEPSPLDQKPPTMGIYEGFNPKKFAPDKQGLIVQRKNPVSLGQFQGNETAGVDANGNCWRELHLRQPQQLAVLHVWYFGVPKAPAARFDEILRTIHVRERN